MKDSLVIKGKMRSRYFGPLPFIVVANRPHTLLFLITSEVTGCDCLNSVGNLSYGPCHGPGTHHELFTKNFLINTHFTWVCYQNFMEINYSTRKCFMTTRPENIHPVKSLKLKLNGT